MVNLPTFLAKHAAGVALTTSYGTAMIVGGAGDAVPDRAYLATLEIALDTIVTGGTVTLYVSRDAAGDVPYSPEVTLVIRTGKTTASAGGVAVDLLSTYQRDTAVGTAGLLYVWAKLNAGTANGLARLTGEGR